MTWRDYLTIVGLVIGALSLWWGFRQSASAISARQAEERVRKELYQSKIIQRFSVLGANLLKVRSLVRSEEYEYAGQTAWDLVSDVSHASGYGRSELTPEELKGLEDLCGECSKVAILIPTDDTLDIDAADRVLIDQICLTSITFVRKLQGRLEILQEHVSEQTGIANEQR